MKIMTMNSRVDLRRFSVRLLAIAFGSMVGLAVASVSQACYTHRHVAANLTGSPVKIMLFVRDHKLVERELPPIATSIEVDAGSLSGRFRAVASLADGRTVETQFGYLAPLSGVQALGWHPEKVLLVVTKTGIDPVWFQSSPLQNFLQRIPLARTVWNSLTEITRCADKRLFESDSRI